MAKILVVEDDARLATLLTDFLNEHEHEAEAVGSAQGALEWLSDHRADLVLVDLGLPDLDGLELCKHLRPDFPGAIVVLTARGDALDEVAGFDAGADDYIAKPLRPEVLLARIRAHLRRCSTSSPRTHIDLGILRINAQSRSVSLRGEELGLSSGEFDLLWFLAQRAGTVVTRDCLYQEFLGRPFDGLDRAIDLRVSKLRKRLGDDASQPQLLKSIRGSGYLLATKP